MKFFRIPEDVVLTDRASRRPFTDDKGTPLPALTFRAHAIATWGAAEKWTESLATARRRDKVLDQLDQPTAAVAALEDADYAILRGLAEVPSVKDARILGQVLVFHDAVLNATDTKPE